MAQLFSQLISYAILLGQVASQFLSYTVLLLSLAVYHPRIQRGLDAEVPIYPTTHVLPPIPEEIHHVTSFEEVEEIINAWADACTLISSKNPDSRLTIMVMEMKTQILGCFLRKMRLEALVSARQQRLEDVKDLLTCMTCGGTSSDPVILSCSHIHCGLCLQQKFRGLLNGRVAESSATSRDGRSLQWLLQNLSLDNDGFNLSFRLAGVPEDSDMTTYPCSTCGYSVSQPPIDNVVLRNIGKGLTPGWNNGQLIPHASFDRLFRRRS